VNSVGANPGFYRFERVYAIAGNLSSHRTADVLLFMLAHPRWEMVFQPKYAA
jgi:transposase